MLTPVSPSGWSFTDHEIDCTTNLAGLVPSIRSGGGCQLHYVHAWLQLVTIYFPIVIERKYEYEGIVP